MSSEEALCSLQSYALDAIPKVDRDYFEIGYPAEFKSKLLENEGWAIRQLLRRGAFARNSALTDSIILDEISGEAGTSGQRFKRSVKLNDKAAVSSALKDVKECLINNPAWSAQIARNSRKHAPICLTLSLILAYFHRRQASSLFSFRRHAKMVRCTYQHTPSQSSKAKSESGFT